MSERFLCRLTRIAISLLCVVCPLRAYAQDTLVALLSDLWTEEKRYEDFDLVFNREYEVVDASNVSQSVDGHVIFVQFIGNMVSKRDERIRFVRQRGMVHVDWTGKSLWSDGSKKSWHRAVCYDGAISRMMDSAPLDRRYSYSAMMRHVAVLPHTLIIGNGIGTHGAIPPLSIYLAGGPSIEVTYVGKGEFQGLACKKVQIARHRADTPSTWQELWLAESRNLIPARKLEYKSALSADLPHAEASVEKWKEIQPGTWFPVSITTKKYDSAFLQRDGVQKLRWEERFVADTMVLNPDYPRPFFARLPDSE